MAAHTREEVQRLARDLVPAHPVTQRLHQIARTCAELEALGSRFMTPQVHISSSSSSSVVGGVSSGKVVVTINGRICQLDVPDAVSVRTVTENSQAYVEIIDKNGRTRRIDCSS